MSAVARPDFFIVGHPKCGTTALYRMLRAHPQIYMTELKEPHFFARSAHELERAAAKRLPTNLEQYLSLFEPAKPGQLTGEASTTYLNSPAAAGRIAELCPDAHIVAFLREPASFIRSLHLQLLQSGVETETDLAGALALEPSRIAGADEGASFWQRELLYCEHVHYTEQLRRYHERFGRERVLALIYEDFRGDNEPMVREVLRFLSVDEEFAFEPAEANPTVSVRSSRAGELVHAVTVGRSPLAREAKAAVKSVVPRGLRREASRTLTKALRQRKPPPADEALTVELRRRCADEVSAVSEYLGRDLVTLWGYDRI